MPEEIKEQGTEIIMWKKKQNMEPGENTEALTASEEGKSKKVKKKKSWKRRLLKLAGIILLLYILLIVFLVCACEIPDFMEKMPFYSTITELGYSQQVQTEDIKANKETTLQETREWYQQTEREQIFITSEDGYKLDAVRFLHPEGEDESHNWVLILHGYTGSKTEMYEFGYHYYQMGYQVLVPDLRCQGESEGDFIGMGATDSEDCLLWVDKILELDPRAKVVLHGQSMGAATALLMSNKEDLQDCVKAIVSDAAYTDAYTMFGQKLKEWFHLPAFPLVDTANLFVMLRAGYNLKKDAAPLKAVPDSKVPILFIHGTEDEMIDVDMTYQLYEAAGCEKQLLIVEGAGHAQTQYKDPENYYRTIEDFVSPYMAD